ncbi:unnamed protein product, partial [Brachionus calyciflorus]
KEEKRKKKMNRNNLLPSEKDKFELIKIENIKKTWYHSNPKSLFNLCITTLVENVHTILVRTDLDKDKLKKRPKSKYKLAEHVGPLPSCITELITKEYLKFYLNTLANMERDEYFSVKEINHHTNILNKKLISYYDLLMAFVHTPTKCNINKIDYRQCETYKSILEQKLKAKFENQLNFNKKINTSYFKLIRNKKSNSNRGESIHNDKYFLKSIRSRQIEHLSDRDLKQILKQHKNLEYLDICPCELTNKTVYYLNKYLSQTLRCLRLKNCCNWHLKKETNGNLQAENIFQFDNFSDLDSVDEDIEIEYPQLNEEDSDQMQIDRINHQNFDFDENDDEDDDEDDDDDDDNFDAYLEEYVNRYEQQNNQENRLKTRHSNRHHRCKKRFKYRQKRGHSECRLFKPCLYRHKIRQIKPKIKQDKQMVKAESEEKEQTNNSIIKWLIKRAMKTNEESTKQDNKKSYLGLIEQIKKKANFLAETKMLDKVSISSSNYDDYDLNSLNENNEEKSLKKNMFNEENLENLSQNLSLYSSGSDDSVSSMTSSSISLLSTLSLLSHCSENCSCSSSSFLSSSETSDEDTNLEHNQEEALKLIEKRYIKHHLVKISKLQDKKVARQQKLLEKVANLGSSPINVIQAIAAKALNFKLKNSINQNELETGSSNGRKLKKLENDDDEEEIFDKNFYINYTKNKRLKENDQNEAKFSSSSSENDSQKESKDSQNSNLFSVLRYWMRCSSQMTSELVTVSDEEFEESAKKRAKNRLRTIKSITNSNDDLTEEDDESDKSSNISFNSIIETNSMNKIFAEKFKDELTDFPKINKNKPALIDKTFLQTLNLTRLEHLSLRNLGSNVIKRSMLNQLLKNFKNLKYLDITNCCTNHLYIVKKTDLNEPQSSAQCQNDLIGCLDGLLNLAPNLTHLIMADLTVEDIQANLKFILRLKNLRHLDISNCREKPPLNRFKNPSLLLAKLVYHLSKLTWLDISGTNLTGSSIFKEQDEIDYIKKRLYEDLTDEFNDYQRVKLDKIETIKSGISGLMFLNNVNKYLDFLGCFSCDNSISSRTNIPALKIAGESSEAHLYNGLEVYANDRPLFLLDALNHLFELYRDELIEDKLLGGHLIMNTMEKHLDNSRIQISASASLFYVLKYWKEENLPMPNFYLRRLILTVINGMEEHIDENAMRRNCVLIMCRLNLPDDVLFVSDRLIRILLRIFEDYVEDKHKNAQNDRQEHFVLRTAMHLLNILACSVHGSDKSKVGLISIPVAMNLIRAKIKFKEADDIMEVTWSFLWNITDETPENCRIFLDACDGMNVFMECIQFKKSEIIRNMMGLLGNVAEVKELRLRLCKNDLIGTFRQLLFHTGDGIEIPYNSAGVLVHILSDGPSPWLESSITEHDRQSVIEDIETAIDKWDLHSDRNINYRSFEPIFRLVEKFDNPICQRWGCWALANLTTVYADVYCPLFEKENGRDLLNRIINDFNVSDATKRYSKIVLINVDNYRS